MKYQYSLIASALLASISPLCAGDTSDKPVAYQQNYNTMNQTGQGVLDVNSRTFQQTLAATTKPIVLVVSAQWCKPCQSMKPILEEVARETPDVTFLRIDYDASPDLVQSFNIDSIPVVLFIRPDGYVVDRSVGFLAKQQLQSRVQAFAGSMRR